MFGKNAIVAGLSAVVLSSLIASTASATVYTVVNPGFESPDASGGDVAGSTGWATVAGGAYTSAAIHRSGSQSGKAFGNPGLFQQNINVTDPIGTSYTASVYVTSPTGDAITGSQGAFINIDFLNSSGTSVAMVTGGEEGSSYTSADAKDVFKQILVTAPSVPGTTAIRISLVTGPYSGLPGNPGGAVFFDDVALTSATTGTPEPASLAVLGLAGVGLTARRRTTRTA